MKSRFEPDSDAGVVAPSAPTFVDPETDDASEQRFAASLEKESEHSQARFVIDQAGRALDAENRIWADHPREALVEARLAPPELDCAEAGFSGEDPPPSRPPANQIDQTTAEALSDQQRQPDLDSWRQEVAARVNNYRARKPRAPRYPSLQLKFDEPDASWSAQGGSNDPGATSQLAVGMPGIPPVQEPPPFVETGRILEFPRSQMTPPANLNELAEPMFDRPRILDVPELLPPPPALGGILIEPAEEPAMERRPGFELPLQPTSMRRRIMAAATDGFVVLSAFAAFAYIFLRITSIVPHWRVAIETSAALLGIFWTAYQYLLLVYAGTTPGLRLAKLRLSRFDGSSVPQRIRRWRVLASSLSALSLALGYAWCFLDEDQLCWHDRITRTYMAPKSQ